MKCLEWEAVMEVIMNSIAFGSWPWVLKFANWVICDEPAGTSQKKTREVSISDAGLEREAHWVLAHSTHVSSGEHDVIRGEPREKPQGALPGPCRIGNSHGCFSQCRRSFAFALYPRWGE